MELSVNDKQEITGLLAQMDGDGDDLSALWDKVNEVVEYAYGLGYERGFGDGAENEYGASK